MSNTTQDRSGAEQREALKGTLQRLHANLDEDEIGVKKDDVMAKVVQDLDVSQGEIRLEWMDLVGRGEIYAPEPGYFVPV